MFAVDLGDKHFLSEQKVAHSPHKALQAYRAYWHKERGRMYSYELFSTFKLSLKNTVLQLIRRKRTNVLVGKSVNTRRVTIYNYEEFESGDGSAIAKVVFHSNFQPSFISFAGVVLRDSPTLG